MSKAKGWSAISETLNNALGDLGTLSVETYIGNVKNIVNNEKNGINWDSMLSDAVSAIEGAKGSANVKLALATYIMIDGDAKNFITEGSIPSYVLETHASAVKNGSEFRAKIIGLALGKLTS